MHQLIDWKEKPGGVTFKIEYTFTDGTKTVEPFSFPTAEEAARYYAWHVHVYLRFRVSDFRTAIGLLRPYYLDRDNPFFILFDGGWRDHHSRFQYGVVPRLDKLAQLDVSAYAKIVIEALPIMAQLVPADDELGRKEIMQMYEDIKCSSARVLLAVKRIHEQFSPLKKAQ